jgi:hypothetical protein
MRLGRESGYGVEGPRVPALRRLRSWNVAFRTLHLTAFALFLGGSAYDVEPERLMPALLAAILTGMLLVTVELCQDPRWPFLGKGLMVIAKLGLLLLVPAFPGARIPLLVAVVVLAGIGSHMPRELRHYSVLERRVVSLDEGAGPPALG